VEIFAYGIGGTFSLCNKLAKDTDEMPKSIRLDYLTRPFTKQPSSQASNGEI
jgi:hypothetical protein